MSNIAEGYDRTGPGDFHRFLSIAVGSTAELHSQLYVAMDVGYISNEEFDELYKDADEVGRITAGLRESVGKARSR